MNIMMDNIITGIVKSGNGLIPKTEKKPVHENEGNEVTNTYENGQLPIGLGVVPIIPTGSIFVPRELVVPADDKPLETDIIPTEKKALLPQKPDENTLKDKPVSEQKSEPPSPTPAIDNKNNHTLDISI